METRRYIVEETYKSSSARKLRRAKRTERPFTDVQNLIWDEMCNPLTTDEITRRLMLNAAILAKHQALEKVLDTLELSEEHREAIRSTMNARRQSLVTQPLGGGEVK